MKVIDLLIKWANGEKLLTKIWYEGETYFLINNKMYDWYRNDRNGDTSSFLDNIFRVNAFLNDEVEIIEEGKKIEKINIGKKKPVHRIKKIEKKLNELIDAVNELKNKED